VEPLKDFHKDEVRALGEYRNTFKIIGIIVIQVFSKRINIVYYSRINCNNAPK